MTWEAGQLVKSGQYKIVQQIGKGGFGITYLAEDVHLHRRVVLKRPDATYKVDRDYDKFLRRFKREAQTLAQCSLPHVVRVIEFTVIDELPCLIMDYVEGQTLSEYVRKEGKMPEPLAIKTFETLVNAVHELHQRKIIHCDIHPGNIIIQPSGEPVLIDFGSTKLMRPTTYTVTTTRNQAYSSYEQFMAAEDESESEPQMNWDVYSLAATMFFTVTGTPPQSGVSRKVNGDRLSSTSFVTSGISQPVSKMILRGMALESKDRPGSIGTWFVSTTTPPKPIENKLPVEKTKPRTPTLPANDLRRRQFATPFPWWAMIALASSYLILGIVIGNSNQSYLAVAVAVAVAMAWAVAWAGDGAWAWAWAVAGAGAWATFDLDNFVGFLLICSLSLLGGAVTGHFTSIGIVWGLVYGLLALVQLLTHFVGYAASEDKLREKYPKLTVFFIYLIFSSMGLLSGGALGYWLEAANVLKLPT